MGIADEQSVLMAESDVLQLNSNRFTEKNVFVLEQFEGEAFDFLEKTNALYVSF